MAKKSSAPKIKFNDLIKKCQRKAKDCHKTRYLKLRLQGIAVALLGMSHPIGTMGAGLFFGYIEAANLELQSWDFKREIIDIISASIIYFSAFTLFFQIYARRFINKMRDFFAKIKKKPQLATAEGVEIETLPPNEEGKEGGQEDDRK